MLKQLDFWGLNGLKIIIKYGKLGLLTNLFIYFVMSLLLVV